MDYLLPPINSVGRFTLKSPLDTLLRDDINYKVISIRTIKEMLESDEDVLQFVYLNQGLTKDNYESDIINDIPIITLISPDNSYYYIPANLLSSIPDITGIKFRNKIIAVNLGIIPDDTDLNYLKDEIHDLILSMYGKEPNIEIVDTSQAIIYSKEDYDTYKATRKANIINADTCRSKLIKLQNDLNLMKTKLEAILAIKY